MPAKKERYLLVDGIRGLAIVNMIAYHFLYDVFCVYGVNPRWYLLTPVHIWQQAICWTFITVSGFVWIWGEKANLKRGLLLNFWGFVISAVTVIAVPGDAIWFGILNFLGCAVLLIFPLKKFLQKLSPLAGMGISFLLFALTKNVQSGYLGIFSLKLLDLPRWLYDIKVLTPLGFPYPGFASSDYFGVFPWLFLYIFGFCLCRFFVTKPNLRAAAQRKIPLLTAIGQKSLIIYLLHQPLCMLVCVLIFEVLI